MDEKINEEDRFLSKMRSKHNTKVEDADSMKVREHPVKVENLLDEMNSFPEKIHVLGPVAVGKGSARDTKKDENALHGGEGKDMVGKGD